MAGRHRVTSVEEFAEDGSRVIVDIGGLEVAVFRTGGGYHAVANYYVHQGGPLCEGGLSGRVTASEDGWAWGYEEDRRYIHCPWHGWIFDVRSGENVNSPDTRVPTYDVVVEDGTVYVVR